MIRDCVVMVITQAFSYANNFETVVTVACWYIRGLEACLDGIMAFCSAVTQLGASVGRSVR